LVGVILSPVAELHAVKDEPVKSGNFVTFFTQKFFSRNFAKLPHIFFPGRKCFRKWFRCWHVHIWLWVISKPQFFYSSSGGEITFLAGMGQKVGPSSFLKKKTN
jgi:hypothetical protein